VVSVLDETESAVHKVMDAYSALLPALDDDTLRDAMHGEKNLKDTQQIIDNFRNAAMNALSKSDDHVGCCAVLVSTEDLKDALLKCANERSQRVLDKTAAGARALCVSICGMTIVDCAY